MSEKHHKHQHGNNKGIVQFWLQKVKKNPKTEHPETAASNHSVAACSVVEMSLVFFVFVLFSTKRSRIFSVNFRRHSKTCAVACAQLRADREEQVSPSLPVSTTLKLVQTCSERMASAFFFFFSSNRGSGLKCSPAGGKRKNERESGGLGSRTEGQRRDEREAWRLSGGPRSSFTVRGGGRKAA